MVAAKRTAGLISFTAVVTQTYWIGSMALGSQAPIVWTERRLGVHRGPSGLAVLGPLGPARAAAVVLDEWANSLRVRFPA